MCAVFFAIIIDMNFGGDFKLDGYHVASDTARCFGNQGD
jgi:hypothetical protein